MNSTLTYKPSRILSLVQILALIFGVLSLAIAVPLVCRPFYYAHISALHLPEITPWTAEQIRQAYDEMMDFCMHGAPFGTGVLKWSQDGMAHFADCAVLFRLDRNVLWISLAVLLGTLVCMRFLQVKPARFLGRGPLFWAGSLEMSLFALIAVAASTDFDRFFVLFHHIFFPGKTNWIFYYDVDEIINVLPEVFFRNCAILIVVLLMAGCILEILADGYLRKREKAQAGEK